MLIGDNRRMRTALLLFVLLSGVACRGDAMDAQQAFAEPRAAELAEAAAAGDAAGVKRLVQQGADPNAHGDKGVTVLQYALLAQSEPGMRALLDNGADPDIPGLGGSTVVHNAAIADDAKFLKLLLASRADPNARHGETQAVPLAAAAGPRTDAQFRMLLAAGADPGLVDRTGNTPLHAAAMINAGAHVLLLLDAGANANAKNAQDATFQRFYFKTPASRLTGEARSDREAVVAWLRAHGIPLEAGVAP